ncbi:MAG: L-idonate 5-dehydrogenase [Saprospiraceae bacterium]
MKTFLLYGSKDIKLAEKIIPEPGYGQVIVKPAYTGICGSDVHYFKHGFCGSFVPKKPFALGHEFSGVIYKIGFGVEGLKMGDEVAVDPSMPCSHCNFCKNGKYNLCKSMKYFGSASCDPHIDGGFGQYVLAPAKNCYVLPPGINMSQASLLEPLSVAMHAVKQVDSLIGKSILITGGGPIGQLILRVARSFGALEITVSDVSRYARDFSLRSGANRVVNPLDDNDWRQIGTFDLVFEASGSPLAVENALHVAKRGASIVLIGTLPENFPISGNLIMNKELKLSGSFRFANVFEDAMNLVAAGIINLDGIITDTYAFENLPQAMLRALEKEQTMKVQVIL